MEIYKAAKKQQESQMAIREDPLGPLAPAGHADLRGGGPGHQRAEPCGGGAGEERSTRRSLNSFGGEVAELKIGGQEHRKEAPQRPGETARCGSRGVCRGSQVSNLEEEEYTNGFVCAERGNFEN